MNFFSLPLIYWANLMIYWSINDYEASLRICIVVYISDHCITCIKSRPRILHGDNTDVNPVSAVGTIRFLSAGSVYKVMKLRKECSQYICYLHTFARATPSNHPVVIIVPSLRSIPPTVINIENLLSWESWVLLKESLGQLALLVQKRIKKSPSSPSHHHQFKFLQIALGTVMSDAEANEQKQKRKRQRLSLVCIHCKKRKIKVSIKYLCALRIDI